ncbi:mercuric reductase [Legionella gratiana]|uniref:Mercuric reductase n=1 Tax=Legionella gratiana TaxID=45066 RepID=A0A378JA81_9GAMM|nr:bifunctional TVP38/TMEM64 family protein/FAD-dependent oxidoreductase [Legionella gratiana]KTD14749.1 mercuric reductase [Legionella gratiana]STX44266.1 mercuric reductase [Legionella gratiana]
MNKTVIRRWLPLIILVGLLILFFSFRLNKYLSFDLFRENRSLIVSWTNKHSLIASLLFMGCYIFFVAISFPGAVYLTLIGGFLFGIVWGTVFVVISATIGATLVFFAVRTALGEWLAQKASGWIGRMRQGFQHNAFSYLLTLRLIPLFPFWVVNIVPGLLGVSAKTFILATLIGIIPGSAVYVIAGNGLSHVFAANQSPDLHIIFEPQIIGALLALGALSLISPIYHFFTRSHHKQQSTTNKSKIMKFDLTIIGGGPGGLSLASGCAQLGLKVALLEADKMGGDCLNYGCVPSKSLLAAAKAFYHAKHGERLGIHSNELTIDFQRVMNHVHQVITNIAQHDSVQRFESLGVKVIQTEGRFLSPNTLQAGDSVIQSNYFVIATGTSPFIPSIPGLDKISYLTNETIFSLKEKPNHLIVIGGGPIGCELAQAFAMLGSDVTLLEVLNILPKDDTDCVAIVRDQLKKMNIAIYEHIKELQIKSQENCNITVSFNYQNDQLTITGSHVLVATGRQANINNLDLDKAKIKYTPKAIEVNAHLRTSNKSIYALGDVTGAYQFTHMAEYQAGIVLRNLVFKLPSKVNYRAVPWVTYTEPELAHVGLLLNDALKYPGTKITEWSFADNDRAQTECALKGKIKVITNKKGKILGVTIVGPHAGELILPWVIAVQEQKTLRTFTDVIVPYPTLSEISKRVAGAFYAPKLFSNKTRTLVRWLQKIRIIT